MFTDYIDDLKNAIKKTQQYVDTLQDQIEILSSAKNKKKSITSLLSQSKKLSKAIDLANKKLDYLIQLSKDYDNILLKSQVEEKSYNNELNKIERDFFTLYSSIIGELL